MDGRPEKADSKTERHFHIRAEEKGARQPGAQVTTLKILVVRLGGGYLKAVFPDRAEGGAKQEAIYGRDEWELAGRLKFRGIPGQIPLPGRKRA